MSGDRPPLALTVDVQHDRQGGRRMPDECRGILLVEHLGDLLGQPPAQHRDSMGPGDGEGGDGRGLMVRVTGDSTVLTKHQQPVGALAPRIRASPEVTAVAATRTRTDFAATRGRGRSRICTTSGGPYFSTTAARMTFSLQV